jgi:hypothetical protein
MQLRLVSDLGTLQQIFYQINPSAWAVEFIAQQLVGGAGGSAKSAVHTGAQDGVGLPALWSIYIFV